MRALITGGAGFIGSHLSEALLEAGHQVHVLDNLSTGSIDNITHLKGHTGFSYDIDSVDNEPLLAELIDRADVVFHFAAAVGVKLIVEQPVHTIETNVHGTEVVLKHANKKKKLVVVASTSEVYGKSVDVPFREDSDLVMGPTTKHRWAYACSKAIDEFLALAYWKERKLPVIIVRFFNTVGPRQTGQYGMVIPNLVRQALAGEPITVFGDGSGTESRYFDWHVVVSMNDSGFFETGVNRNREGNVTPFTLNSARGVKVAPGTYDFNEYFALYRSNNAKRVSFETRVSVGDLYNGTRNGYAFAPTVRVNEHLNASVSLQINDIDLPNASYVSKLIATRLNYSLNTRVFFNALVQYNTDTQQWSSNLRFNVIHRPLSDIFLVYNERRLDTTGDLVDRALIAKVTYLLAF